MTKKLIISFLSIVLAGILLFMGFNYYVDPYTYFRYKSGVITEKDPHKNERVLGAYTLKNADEGTYGGIIVGGSKTRVISPDMLKHYTGLDYLSCVASSGDFGFYEKIIKYAWQTQKIKHVFLHFSGIETYYELPDGESLRIPSIVENGSELSDIGYYLSSDIKTTVQKILKKSVTIPTWDKRFKNGNKILSYSPTAEENADIAGYLGITDDEIQMNSPWMGEARMWSALQKRGYYKSAIKDGDEARRAWAEKTVYKYYGEYNDTLKSLFYDEKDLKNVDNNIEILKRIKEFCDSHDIELTVMIGAVSLVERSMYEGEQYWDYMYRIAQITDFYDFSYFCDITQNPYNFSDCRHYLDSMAWLQIDSIYDKNEYDFGKHITKENISDYLKQRKADYYKVKEEFDKTGTVVLPDINSPSDMSRLPNEFYDKLCE